MDMNQVLKMVGKMFPSANVGEAAQKASQMIQGTQDNLNSVSQVAKNMGIDQNAINTVFQKYGNTMQAKALCSMLGTTPEALKKDAESIIGASGNNTQKSDVVPTQSKRFPRLK